MLFEQNPTLSLWYTLFAYVFKVEPLFRTPPLDHRLPPALFYHHILLVSPESSLLDTRVAQPHFLPTYFPFLWFLGTTFVVIVFTFAIQVISADLMQV